jgi:hypothetical protein
MGVPVNYSWSARNKKRTSGIGTVRDMSVEGIFVLSQICPLIGARVDIEIGRPEQRRRPRRCIKARMKVVRIDQNENGTGFAAHGKVFIGDGAGKRGSGGSTSGPFIVRNRQLGTELDRLLSPDHAVKSN